MSMSMPLNELSHMKVMTAVSYEDQKASLDIFELLVQHGAPITPAMFDDAVKLAKSGNDSLWRILLLNFTTSKTDARFSKEELQRAINDFLDYSQTRMDDVKKLLEIDQKVIL